MASLSRFLSRLGEKALPLYQLLKKSDKFVWNAEADQAFLDLKKMLSTAQVLAAPAPGEPMMLYIAATPQVVSAVFMVEHPEGEKNQLIQRPVYYISEVLSQSKQNYPITRSLSTVSTSPSSAPSTTSANTSSPSLARRRSQRS